MTVVPVTSPDLDAAEVSWFAALCSDDYRFLGVPEGDLRSSWAHCSSILKEAEARASATSCARPPIRSGRTR
jgi:alkanesulfonate monooxygenase